jgi:hypothetical protein
MWYLAQDAQMPAPQDSMKQISVYVDKDIEAQLTDIVSRGEVKRQVVIREAIRNFCKKARRRGVLPISLAANQKAKG